VTVRWASALPVKQAIVRSRYQGDFEESDRDKQLLNQVETQYVVLVSSLPARMARTWKNTELIQKMTTLNRRKHDPIQVELVKLVPRGDFFELFLFFPRSEEITLQNKDVEFRTELGPFKIKRRFKLKNYGFKDRLEL
jgi:hypothetical protein